MAENKFQHLSMIPIPKQIHLVAKPLSQENIESVYVPTLYERFKKRLSCTGLSWLITSVVLLLMMLTILTTSLYENQNKSSLEKLEATAVLPTVPKMANSMSFQQNTTTERVDVSPSQNVTDDEIADMGIAEKESLDVEESVDDTKDELHNIQLGKRSEKSNKTVSNGVNRTNELISQLTNTPAPINTLFVLSSLKNLVENGSEIGAIHNFLHGLVNDGSNISANKFQTVVEYLVAQNLSKLFNMWEKDLGRTLLMLAAKNVELDMGTISLLERNEVDLTLMDNDGSSYLSYAAEGNKNIKLLMELTKAGSIRHTKLIPAIMDMDGDSVKVLVSLGADPNEKNSQSEAPLLLTAMSKNKTFAINIIKFLINSGAHPLAKQEHDSIFLHILVTDSTTIKPSQFHDLATFLISRDLPLLFNVRNGHGNTPFQMAVEKVEVEMDTLTLLKNNEVDFNAVDNGKQSVLYWATLGNRSKLLISNLVALGANPKQLSILNCSVLHVAAAKGNVNLVKLFLEMGLEDNARDKWGYTPLYHAIYFKHNVFKTAQFLLKNGANGDILDVFGNSARDHFNMNRESYRDRDKISTCLLLGSLCDTLT